MTSDRFPNPLRKQYGYGVPDLAGCGRDTSDEDKITREGLQASGLANADQTILGGMAVAAV